jgi:hypothetical protein
MIGGFLVHKWAKNPSILYNSAIGHLIIRSFADDLWVCMGLLIAQKCFEQFRAPASDGSPAAFVSWVADGYPEAFGTALAGLTGGL